MSLADSTNQPARFAAAGWDTAEIDGHDPEAIAEALEAARTSDRPTLIAAKTTIGFGAPTKAGTNKAHGSPLGAEEIAGARKFFGWDSPPFEVPADILAAWRAAGQASAGKRADWQKRLAAADPAIRAEFERRIAGTVAGGFRRDHRRLQEEARRRQAEGRDPQILRDGAGGHQRRGARDDRRLGRPDRIEQHQDQPDQGDRAGNYGNRYVHYGIREHGMAAAMNGLTLHGGVIPYGGTFLCFSDYARPSMRLASLMGIRSIFVMTHDSIGLGEDGPTHQPVEHLAALRAIPNHLVFRPADAIEAAECWQLALESTKTPSTLALTRQNLPAVRTEFVAENLCAQGAYELAGDRRGRGDDLRHRLGGRDRARGPHAARSRRPSDPRRLGPLLRAVRASRATTTAARRSARQPVKVAIEAAIRQGWDHFIGTDGIFIGMTGFGASGTIEQLYPHFGITAEAAAKAATARLSK